MKFSRILRPKIIATKPTASLLESVPVLSGYFFFILLLGLFLIGCVCLFTKNQIDSDYSRTIEETSLETMNLNIAFEEHVRKIIADVDKDLFNLKAAYEQDGLSSPIFITYGQNAAKDPTRNSIAVYNEQGVIIASFIQNTLGFTRSDREYFLMHQDSLDQDLHIGKSIISRSSSQQIIPLTRRINKADGSFGGIVFVGLKTDYFLSFYQKINLGQHQLIALTGMDGFNRARQSNDNIESGQDMRNSTFWKKSQENIPSASYVATNIYDGVTRIMSYRIMPEYPLIVTVGKSAQIALATHEQRKRSYILGAILVIFFILLLCILLINRAKKQRDLNITLEKMIGERTQELQAQYELLQRRDEELFELNCKLVKKNVDIHTEKDRLSSLVNSMSDEVWFTDLNKNSTLLNPAGLHEFGIISGQINIVELAPNLEILRPDGSIRPIEEAPPLRALQGEIIRNEQEMIQIPISGNFRYHEINSNPIVDINGNITGSVSVVRDITKRKAMEDELTKHRDHLQILVDEQVKKIHTIHTELAAIFDSISDPFYVLDTQWRFTYINKQALQARIKMKQPQIGQNIWEVSPELIETQLYQQCHTARASNTPIHTIYKSRSTEKVFDIHLYPYSKGLLVYFRDITEQKKYEVEMSKLDRLNIIGEMAASIGHEVRNPMTTVRGYLQWFSKKVAFAGYTEQLAVMIDELDRANSILTEFLSLAKNKKVQMELTHLNNIIESLFPLLQADALHRGSTIELCLENIPEIYADDKEIRQCILNLVSNGLDAMPTGGMLTISTTLSENKIIMTIHDRGLGIPLEIADQLWIPFFTTKEHGTGLGLPVCYQIAQRNDAIIEVETNSEGTKFHVIFNQNQDRN